MSMKRLKILGIALLLAPGTIFAAFPAIESSTSGEDLGSGSNTIELTLPATIGADSVILGCISVDHFNENISTSETGVSELFVVEDASLNVNLGCFCKAADGTEDGASWTIDTPVSDEGGSWVSFSITGTFDNTCASVESANAKEVTTPATTPDPPSLNPAGWGSEDTIWFAMSAPAQDWTNTLTSYPTDCADNQFDKSGLSGRAFIALCSRSLNAASWDPGVFTWGNSIDWAAATVAIRPAASTNPLRRRR